MNFDKSRATGNFVEEIFMTLNDKSALKSHKNQILLLSYIAIIKEIKARLDFQKILLKSIIFNNKIKLLSFSSRSLLIESCDIFISSPEAPFRIFYVL